MKRFIISALSLAFSIMGIYAQISPEKIIGNVVNDFKKSKSLQATVSLTSGKNSTNGTLIIQGNCFYLKTGQAQSWFDGKTQWSYIPEIGEVNIITPTKEDLQSTNPYSIVQTYSQNFRAMMLKNNDSQNYSIKLVPKTKGSDVKEMVLDINKTSNKISKILIVASNGVATTIKISNYKIGANYPATTFKFNKNLVPKGTPIVDLR